MGLPLFLLFVVLPLAELALLIKVGSLIGVLPTVALVIGTAALGVTLIRWQGVAVLRRAKEALDRGDTPVDAVLDGTCLLVAGILLLAPGLITDTLGLLLLVPLLRRALAHALWGHLGRSGRFDVHMWGAPSSRRGREGPIIEGEFEHIDPDAKRVEETRPGGKKPPPPSGWRIEP